MSACVCVCVCTLMIICSIAHPSIIESQRNPEGAHLPAYPNPRRALQSSRGPENPPEQRGQAVYEEPAGLRMRVLIRGTRMYQGFSSGPREIRSTSSLHLIHVLEALEHG